MPTQTRHELAVRSEGLLSRAGARLLLVGDRGMGKSTMLAQLLDRRRSSSPLVLVPASEVEHTVGFAVLGDLLAAMPDAVEALPAALHEQMRPLVEPTTCTVHEVDQRLVGVGLALVLQQAAQPSVTLAIDDLHWVDEASYVALAYALRRLRGADVRVLATRLPQQARTIPDAAVLEIPPLTPAEVRCAVAARTGRRLTTETSIAVQQAVGGNPMHVLAVAADLPDDAAPADVRLPRSLIELVRDRLDALPHSTRAALLDIAVRGVLPLDQPLVPPDLHPAVVADVLAVRRGAVEFTHPLLRRSVVDTAPPAALSAARRRAADAEADPVRRAVHLAALDSAPEDDIADLLEDAARLAAHRADLAAATLLALRAVRLTPAAAGASVRWQRTYLAAQLAASTGELPDWLEQQLVATARSPDDVVLGLLVLGRAQQRDNHGALLRVEQALLVPEASAAARARAVQQLTAFRFLHGDPIPALAEQLEPALATLLAAEGQRAPTRGADPDERLERADLLSLHAYWCRLAGLPVDGAVLAPAASPHPGTPLAWLWGPRRVQAQMVIWDDRHEQARSLLEREARPWLALHARGEPYAHEPGCLYPLVELEVRLGNLDAAEQHLARLPPDSTHPWRFLTAMVAAWRGDVARCRREVDQGLARAAAAGDRVWPLAMHSALALGLLAADDPESAWREAYPVCQEMHRRGWVEPSVFPVLPVAIEAGTRTGRIEQSQALHDRLRHAASALDSRWARAAADRCSAHLAMAVPDSLDDAFGLAVRSSEAFAALGLRLEAGRSALTAGRAARRAGRRREARMWLETAIDRFSPVVSGGFALQATEEKSRLGGRPAAGTTLTPAERRVADLAARGASNPEIAEAEFLSVKTVETHLSRIYRKLGVRSRAQLASRYASAHREPQTMATSAPSRRQGSP